MIELKKVHYFFEATILSSPSDIIPLKFKKFLKTGVHEKCVLISSRGKFTWTFLPKIIVGIIDQEFLF